MDRQQTARPRAGGSHNAHSGQERDDTRPRARSSSNFRSADLTMREKMRDNSNLRLLGLVMLLAPCARGQLAMKSVPELISSLANTEQRQNAIGVFGCGITQEFLRERSVARELASRGKAAVPELDRALGSLERDGEDSSFFDRTGWLLFAYARAQGPASVSTLMRMIRSPKLDSLHISLDRAIALSLGLTSYVSSGREGGPMFICRRPEPKDALDEFLLALERGDRSELESSIGPQAGLALDRLLNGRSWEALRQELWHAPPGAQGAVGYLFDIRGRWSEPEETLEENRNGGDDPLTEAVIALDTQFKTSSGKDCAKYFVRFKKVSELGRVKYLVDNTDLRDLIGSIGVCFAP
jgi:hypothetical protein